MNTIIDQKYHVGFCGSGEYSVRCAEALANDERFALDWVLCPPPRPAGRGNTMRSSDLQIWAESRTLPVHIVETNISQLRPTLESLAPVEFLVVVSFGYLIPEWFLELPTIAPVNVHPSALPFYRGSSPGQFTVLYGETHSSVSIMTMSARFDEGAIITQLPLELDAKTTQTEFYEQAFELARKALPEILSRFALERKTTPQTPLPENAVIARRLSREDGFVPYAFLELAQQNGNTVAHAHVTPEMSPALQELISHQPLLTVAQVIDRAVRALTPWPGIWTRVPEYKGKENVRLKIHETVLHETGNCELLAIQYEGEAPRKS